MAQDKIKANNQVAWETVVELLVQFIVYISNHLLILWYIYNIYINLESDQINDLAWKSTA